MILKSAHTVDFIFFLVEFPDKDESRDHKPLIWNKEKGMYQTGKERGDSFVFKWNMEPSEIDLSYQGDRPYLADIWYWKAGRTDRTGFADDKTQILSFSRMAHSVKVISKSGYVLYLSRPGDKGIPAYESRIPFEYEGDKIQRFTSRAPTGSRADVRAKGKWKDGKWVVEFQRALFTGNGDDVQFELNEEYLFGISRYEIGGQRPSPNKHPHGSGDVTEALHLIFEN